MIQWDYQVISGLRWVGEVTERSLTLKLNDQGTKGWELVTSIIPFDKDEPTLFDKKEIWLIFKRPRIQSKRT